MKERKRYFDTIKLFAIFVVFTTHFVATFNDDYFRYWTDLPTSVLLKGVSGKFGVAIFSVILGYFAFRSSERNIAKYTIKRYVYFLLCGFFINAVYAVCGRLGYVDVWVTLPDYLKTSLLLSDAIYPTFWCIQPFMAGSVISRINGELSKHIKWYFVIIIIEILALLKAGQLWIAICLMGNLVYIFENDSLVSSVIAKRPLRIIIYLAAFVAIKRSGSDLTYLIDGISASFVLLALSKSEHLIKPLNNKHLASAGKTTMAIYLIHNILYENIGRAMISDAHFVTTFLAAFAVSWIVILFIAYPVTTGLNGASLFCGKLIDMFFALFKRPEKELQP